MKRAYVYFWETPFINAKQKKGYGLLKNCNLIGEDLFDRLTTCIEESHPDAFMTGLTEIPNGND